MNPQDSSHQTATRMRPPQDVEVATPAPARTTQTEDAEYFRRDDHPCIDNATGVYAYIIFGSRWSATELRPYFWSAPPPPFVSDIEWCNLKSHLSDDMHRCQHQLNLTFSCIGTYCVGLLMRGLFLLLQLVLWRWLAFIIGVAVPALLIWFLYEGCLGFWHNAFSRWVVFKAADRHARESNFALHFYYVGVSLFATGMLVVRPRNQGYRVLGDGN